MKPNLGLPFQHILSTVDLKFSGNVLLMQAGVSGHPSGVSAVATVRRVENQFHRSQGPGHVFRKPTEVRIAPSLRNKPE